VEGRKAGPGGFRSAYAGALQLRPAKPTPCSAPTRWRALPNAPPPPRSPPPPSPHPPKVFASNYTRLRALDALDDLEGLLGGGAHDAIMGGVGGGLGGGGGF
jgi:hypothetical protein